MRTISINEISLDREIRAIIKEYQKEYNVLKPCVLTYERFIEIKKEKLLTKYRQQ